MNLETTLLVDDGRIKKAYMLIANRRSLGIMSLMALLDTVNPLDKSQAIPSDGSYVVPIYIDESGNTEMWHYTPLYQFLDANKVGFTGEPDIEMRYWIEMETTKVDPSEWLVNHE